MWLLLIEVLIVLLLLGGAVWWTMFSGRPKDAERQGRDAQGRDDDPTPGR